MPRGGHWTDWECFTGEGFEPLFPVEPLTPESTCPHHGPIAAESGFVCMICYRSGVDDRPVMKPNRHDPKPEKKPPAAKPAPARKKQFVRKLAKSA